jgi:hypothetical protein
LLVLELNGGECSAVPLEIEPLDRKQGVPHIRFEWYGEERKDPLVGIRTASFYTLSYRDSSCHIQKERASKWF